MKDAMRLMGLRARDKVTGLEGVVTCISFDLYGCIQAVLHPGRTSDGKLAEVSWFDTKRLVVLSDVPVMEVPNFEVVPGPEKKPALR